jgi:protein subunit release factor B
MKELLFSVTRKDCRFDYYRGSGKGGQKRNKTDNCCRCTHIDSGAVGKSEEGRSKEHNRRLAFERMAETDIFKKWHKIEISRRLGHLADAEAATERAMSAKNIRVEIKEDDKWMEES